MNEKLLASMKRWWWAASLIFAASGTYYKTFYKLENHETRIVNLETTVNGRLTKFEEKLDAALAR